MRYGNVIDYNIKFLNLNLDVGSSFKISVECNDEVKQLYMMWEPVTSGAYLGLYEISDFIVTEEKG